jgi:porin
LLPPAGGSLVLESDSWALYWNFDQYLAMDPCDPTKGWGVFGRAAIADADTNPLEWFVSFGIGGNSRIAGRESDTFGVGWAYNSVSN